MKEDRVTIIHFPGPRQSVPKAPKSIHPAIPQENINQDEAVRHFALTVAAKIRNDPELNHIAPFIVDKIIMMLVQESRQKHLSSVDRIL